MLKRPIIHRNILIWSQCRVYSSKSRDLKKSNELDPKSLTFDPSEKTEDLDSLVQSFRQLGMKLSRNAPDRLTFYGSRPAPIPDDELDPAIVTDHSATRTMSRDSENIPPAIPDEEENPPQELPQIEDTPTRKVETPFDIVFHTKHHIYAFVTALRKSYRSVVPPLPADYMYSFNVRWNKEYRIGSIHPFLTKDGFKPMAAITSANPNFSREKQHRKSLIVYKKVLSRAEIDDLENSTPRAYRSGMRTKMFDPVFVSKDLSRVEYCLMHARYFLSHFPFVDGYPRLHISYGAALDMLSKNEEHEFHKFHKNIRLADRCLVAALIIDKDVTFKCVDNSSVTFTADKSPYFIYLHARIPLGTLDPAL
ncbi:hypothetical protein CANCADRAFT_115962 [Tortispora caseinolytica NRRL Y-17796]|uniref:Uncharacterized protein n=1 Tax=Tortispora caseinolytica NRRL Y-17796 TaxID=767744 RepID=A0A1E4TH90_9ASCO|nr:hypothetical protein CANCADRAFT_115962 [Tortispora caseinolytica NRRL Y-17796]